MAVATSLMIATKYVIGVTIASRGIGEIGSQWAAYASPPTTAINGKSPAILRVPETALRSSVSRGAVCSCIVPFATAWIGGDHSSGRSVTCSYTAEPAA
jgi:hypothetical protein